MIEHEEEEVWFNAIQTANVTAVIMKFDGVEADGDAKRNKGEVWQKNVGYDLATGRAFINLGEQLIERARAQLPPESEQDPLFVLWEDGTSQVFDPDRYLPEGYLT